MSHFFTSSSVRVLPREALIGRVEDTPEGAMLMPSRRELYGSRFEMKSIVLSVSNCRQVQDEVITFGEGVVAVIPGTSTRSSRDIIDPS